MCQLLSWVVTIYAAISYMDSYFTSIVNLHFCWLRSSLGRFCTVFALPKRRHISSLPSFCTDQCLLITAWQPFQTLLNFASKSVFLFSSTTKVSMNYAFICIDTSTRLGFARRVQLSKYDKFCACILKQWWQTIFLFKDLKAY